jgi:DME family drug/metabolite transporter
MSVLSRPAIAGVPLLVAAGLLWGTGGLLGTLLAEATGLAPVAVAGYRLLTGGLLLLLVASGLRAALPARRRAVVGPTAARSLPPWRWGGADRRRVIAIGALAAGFQACYFAAVATTSVSLATLVTIGAAPVIVLLVDRVRGRPAARSTTAAGVLGVLGLALLLGVPVAGNGVAGAGFALLAAAGFAVMTLIGARPGPDPAWATGISFTGGGAVLLVVAQATPIGGIGFAATPWALLVLAAFGVLPTALAYTLYFRGLVTAPAAVGAVVALLEPLTGAVLAAVVLGERLGPVGIAGAVALGAAVVLAGRSR